MGEITTVTFTHHTWNPWRGWCICWRGDAVAVTISQVIPGFRGYRRRWWEWAIEQPFPNWRDAGVGNPGR